MISVVKTFIAIQALFAVVGAETALRSNTDLDTTAEKEMIAGQENEELKVSVPSFNSKIISTFAGTGLCMDAFNGVMGDIKLWGTHGGQMQRWSYTPSNCKPYGEISVILNNGGKGCLSASRINSITPNNAFFQAITAPCNRNDVYQQMYIQPRFSGNFIMVSTPFGIWCLNLFGAILTPGTAIGWYSCYGVPHDTWGFV